MRMIITGGSGFIGTNLVEHFANGGHQVLNLDIVGPRNPAHGPYWQRCDICDAAALMGSFSAFEPEVVLHLAARTDLDGRTVADYPANVQGVGNVLAAARSLPVRPFTVMFSSMLVCRLGHVPRAEDDYCPTTAYGESKVMGERLVRGVPVSELPWVMLRPTSIWGPWFATPYRNFFEAVERGLYLHPRGRRVRRNYGFVLNSVHQVDHLVAARGGPLVGRTVYMADREPVDLHRWATLISQALQAPRVSEVPVRMLRVAARLGDMARALGYRNPPLTSFRLDNMLTDCLLDTDPLSEIAGPAPYALEQAVALTCDWMRRTAQAQRAP